MVKFHGGLQPFHPPQPPKEPGDVRPDLDLIVFSQRLLNCLAWSGWPQKSLPAAASTSDFCSRGTASGFTTRETPCSFQKFMMNLLSPAPCLAHVHSSACTVLTTVDSAEQVRYEKTTLRPKRPSPHVSACPWPWDGKLSLSTLLSHAEPRQLYMPGPILFLVKLHPLSTQWWPSRFFRPSSSALWMSPSCGSPEMVQLLSPAPWPIPLRRDLLSQAKGTICHPHPDLWSLHLWPLTGVFAPSPGCHEHHFRGQSIY